VSAVFTQTRNASGLSIGTSFNYVMDVGATAGSGADTLNIASNAEGQALVAFASPGLDGFSWNAGTVTARLRITTLNMAVNWVSVSVQRRSSSGTLLQTLGTATMAQALSTATVFEQAVSIVAATSPASTDRLVMVYSFTNTNTMNAQSFGFTADVNNDTPLVAPAAVKDGSFTHTGTAQSAYVGRKVAAFSFTQTATAQSAFAGDSIVEQYGPWSAAVSGTTDAVPVDVRDGSFTATAVASATFTGQVVVDEYGPWSEPVSGTTSSGLAVPAPPVLVSATAVGQTRIDLLWQKSAGATGYRVRRRLKSVESWKTEVMALSSLDYGPRADYTPPTGIAISAGTYDPNTFVSGQSAGTVFVMGPGIHRWTNGLSSALQNNMAFHGWPGAIISGSKDITAGPWVAEGDLRYIEGQTQRMSTPGRRWTTTTAPISSGATSVPFSGGTLSEPRWATLNPNGIDAETVAVDSSASAGSNTLVLQNPVQGSFPDGTPIEITNYRRRASEWRAGYPEWVFLNDDWMQHVPALRLVSPGRFYFDYARNRIYLHSDDVVGASLIEASVTERAFYGSTSYTSRAAVRIQNLTIEKFTPQLQNSMCDALESEYWVAENCKFHLCYARGVTIGGSGGQTLGCQIVDNGQLGISGSGTSGTWTWAGGGHNLLVEGNEIARNGEWSGTSATWEAGGSKWANTTNLVIRRNWAHNNYLYAALWADINNTYTLYERNLVEDNYNDGIFHEISFDAVIRYNVCRRNGWLEQSGDVSASAGIRISTSQRVLIHDNVLDDNYQNLTATIQDRTASAIRFEPFDRYILRTLLFRGNDVRAPTRNSVVGVRQHSSVPPSPYLPEQDIRFRENHYRVAPALSGSLFRWVWGDGSGQRGFLQWQNEAVQDVGITEYDAFSEGTITYQPGTTEVL
jgi:hypothetical protein